MLFRCLIAIIYLQITSESYSQIELINTATNRNLNIPSIIGNNILVGGNINYLSKSYNECDNFIPLTIPGYIGNTNFYQRLSPNLMFGLSADFNNYDFKIFKSVDDGQSWNSVFDSIGGGAFFMNFAFFDSNEGIVFDMFNGMVRTNNGGANWQNVTHPLTVVTAVSVCGDSILAVAGKGPNAVGGIIISKTRGTSWVSANGCNLGKGTPTDVFFLNKDTIFGIASAGLEGPQFTKSFNGGKNWSCNTIGPVNIIPYGLYAETKNEIYAVGATSGTIGIILKSTDLGQTWGVFNTGIKSELMDIRFLNDSIALVSGSNGVLFKWNRKTAVFTSLTVGLQENSLTDLSLKIFPNPVTDKLSFQFDSLLPEGLNLKISNALGQTVYSKTNVDLTEQLNISFLKSGVYYLKLENTEGQKVFKVIKE